MRISVNPYVLIYFVLLVFWIPLTWLSAWLFAVAFHEFCHWIMAKACGGHINQLYIGFGGALMESDTLSEGKYLLSVLSGPIGGLLLLFLGRWLPRVALCSWLLTAYNLIPILPLDGGRALQLVIRNEKTFCTVQKVVLYLLTLGGVYLSVWLRMGLFPLAVIAILWMKNRNCPCNAPASAVQ